MQCGQEPNFSKTREPKIALIQFIFNEKDLQKLERAKKEIPEKIFYISEIEDINSHKVIDSSSRHGHFILACDTVEEAIKWSK